MIESRAWARRTSAVETHAVAVRAAVFEVCEHRADPIDLDRPIVESHNAGNSTHETRARKRP